MAKWPERSVMTSDVAIMTFTVNAVTNSFSSGQVCVLSLSVSTYTCARVYVVGAGACLLLLYVVAALVEKRKEKITGYTESNEVRK